MTFAAPPVPVVLDASVVVDLAIGERADTPVALARWVEEGRMLLVPPIHWPEVGNSLLRRFDGDALRAGRRMEEIDAIGIEVADRGLPGVVATLGLAARHRLTVYDASYLWLAITLPAELATLDRALARAAVAEDVTLALVP